MEYIDISIDSYIGSQINQELVTQGSKTLFVILPGGGHTIMAPYLYYSFGVGIERGYDVLSIEYGFHQSTIGYSPEDFDEILNEARMTLSKAMALYEYDSIVFCAKCFGSRIVKELAKDYKNLNLKCVMITPHPDSLEVIKLLNSFVIVGTNDNALNIDQVNQLKLLSDVKLKVIEGADHDLDVEDMDQSIFHLRETIREIATFI